MSIKPLKHLGQNFLTDKNISAKIAASLDAPQDGRVIEIGPGEGAMTEFLFQKYPAMTALEVDERAVEHLNRRFPSLDVKNKDILKTDWNNLLGEADEKAWVIGNLPYYITSPILFSVLDNYRRFEQAVFMVQKEVAERICSSAGTKAYGILSVQTQFLAKATMLFTVPRHVFRPVPGVDSAVIKITMNDSAPVCSPKALKTVVRTAFNQRRKKLRNALAPITGKQAISEFDLTRRAEELSVQEFADLTILLQQRGMIQQD